MIRFNDILEQVTAYNPQVDLDFLKKAYIFSAKVHKGQVRLSGEPYLIHPLEVANILARLRLDTASVVTGLLHDTLEDTFASLEELRENFGEEVTQLVDGVTKISKITLKTSEEDQAENFRKMILAMVKDIRVILVKLADRIHNMRTLKYQLPSKQKTTAQETLEIYSPLANRLGIEWIKKELEDLSFRYLHPDIYTDIQRRIAKKEKERERYIEEVKRIITKKLFEYKIEAEVMGRPKQIYSIYKKMNAQDIDFDQVYDLTAFRVIVNTVKQCYEALGILHSLWKPVPGKFKDYIGLPKANRYKSLHTAVIGLYGERMEIQIRTSDMHQVAEEGIAAHWKYKEEKFTEGEDDKRITWLRQLLEWQRELQDNSEFLETVKMDLYPNDVYVFTPKGEVKEFPRGATPIDFAYSIHSDVGHRCIGAKVGGRLVPLKYQLKSGDSVEILTSPNHKPSKDWLKFVKTSRAKTKIRQWIKKEQRERSIALGREICEKEFRRFSLNFAKLVKSGKMEKVTDDFGFQAVDDLMASVGYGKISSKQIVGKLVPPEELEAGDKKKESRIEKIIQLVQKKPQDAIKIQGVDDMMVRFASCCNPLPGDRITGFITRGRGITIHTVDCSNVLNNDPQRKVKVEWDLRHKHTHPVRIRVICTDRKGLLADISSSITSNEANITNAQLNTTQDKRAICTFAVEIKDLNHLRKVIASLEKIKGIVTVERLKI
ncbi:MAG: bifunctional (p)ppGpp synthetase/guanosine-3',5'-bis(diphosphate) 3'-pyrophosphohydrolase [Syntrophobacterales bacterium]|nr:MAG: bifunctional (p)ppGpp synthetase/guanosine-3',5'-bis(diphosphate) 3'-pyrophosphohydrolase [Syntrophobacterales bacterium]